MRRLDYASVQFHPSRPISSILLADLVACQSFFETCFPRALRTGNRIDPLHKAFPEPPDQIERKDIGFLELESEVVVFWLSGSIENRLWNVRSG